MDTESKTEKKKKRHLLRCCSRRGAHGLNDDRARDKKNIIALVDRSRTTDFQYFFFFFTRVYNLFIIILY